MDQEEKNVPTSHNAVVVVSQDDKNHMPSSAEASPQMANCAKLNEPAQSSPTVLLVEKKKNYLAGNSDTIFSWESRKDIIIAMQEHLANTIPWFIPTNITHL